MANRDMMAAGWRELYRESPKVHGLATVSRPAIDRKNGLVLLYMDTSTDYLAANGWVILFEYKGGALKVLKKILVWQS